MSYNLPKYVYIYMFQYYIYTCLIGGLNPSEKCESQLGVFFPTEWKNVPNHPPDYIYIYVHTYTTSTTVKYKLNTNIANTNIQGLYGHI